MTLNPHAKGSIHVGGVLLPRQRHVGRSTPRAGPQHCLGLATAPRRMRSGGAAGHKAGATARGARSVVLTRVVGILN